MRVAPWIARSTTDKTRESESVSPQIGDKDNFGSFRGVTSGEGWDFRLGGMRQKFT